MPRSAPSCGRSRCSPAITASRLLDAVVDPGTPAYLWVAAGNGRAIAFYRKHGFDLDGAARHDAEWDCHELRMRRSV
ncbi:hypothetical protein GCM10009551_090760 [Nocardiopsis tropica]